MSVPIFNRRATHNSILSARIAMRKQQLAVTDAEQSLRKEIEQAWYNADAAYGKYRSADAALTSARVAFAYEQQKADAGRSTVFDFNDAKTRMERPSRNSCRRNTNSYSGRKSSTSTAAGRSNYDKQP